jgi:hypothetical protein
MHIETLQYIDNTWQKDKTTILNKADIVFTFGDRDTFKSPKAYEALKKLYPDANIVGCSSSGNIQGDALSVAPMIANAVSFDSGSGYVHISIKDFSKDDDQINVTKELINNLPKENLKHVFILSDGLNINGSSLAKGANQALNYDIPITGGLAGDGTAFEETWVIANDFAKQNRIVAVGFYGDNLHITSGCFAGWEEFGVLRKVSKSTNNIVYEIDNQPALTLYKKYLGEYAKDLPASGLRFPISIKQTEEDIPIVRSVLGVDEETQSLIFAGDVPEGSLARLMKTDIDGLIDGAQIAANHANYIHKKTALGLVVSCIGRRLVLNQLTDEELESVSDVLGENVKLSGFYSYGELAPFSDELMSCQLHNQTLTLTIIYEE